MWRKFIRWLFTPRGLALTGALCVALGVLVGGSFLAGFYLGDKVGINAVKGYVKGIIDPSSRKTVPAGAWKMIPTALHEVVIDRVSLPDSERTGGAIEQVDGKLLFATPDGRLGYVTEDQPPVVLDVRVPMNNDALRRDPIADHPTFDIQYIRVTDMLVLDEGPSRYRMLVSHHRYDDGCVELRVSALTLEARGGRLEPTTPEMTSVFVAKPCIGFRPNGEYLFSGHQAGGRMVPYDDGRILLSVGDHHFDGIHGMPEPMPPDLPEERAFAMDPRVSLGKMLLLDPRTGESEIFASGVRNPQGLVKDDRGRIWATEHGPQGGDELNLMERGRNYGWPEVTLGVEYGDKPWPFNPAQGRHTGYTAPQYAWVPSIAVSNLVQSRGGHFPLWEGDLLVTSLLRMTVFRLRTEGDHVTYMEPIEIGERIRDVIVLDDGRIALYADSANAILILRNSHGAGAALSGSAVGQVAQTAAPQGRIVDADSKGARVFQAHCASCHSLGARNGIGPRLDGVMGREAGTAEGFTFSPALRNAGKSWTRRRMAEFILEPQSVYQGSRMAAVRLSEPDLESLLTFLEAQERRYSWNLPQ